MKAAGITIRPATPDDYPAIAEMLDKAFSRVAYERRLKLWHWRYHDNPARTSVEPMSVAERGGKIVGVHALVPLRVKVGTAVLTALCGCDLAADASARTVGMQMKALGMSPELAPLHVATSANLITNKITLALGGKEVGLGRQILLKPLRVNRLVHRRIARDGGALRRLGATVASAVLARPVDASLAVMRLLRGRALPPGAAIEDITHFDARFDAFWDAVSNVAPIMHVRDAAYLNWRYARYPFPGITSFALVREQRVLGFAVIHQTTDPDGVRSAAILELLADASETGAFETLLDEAIRRAAASGADVMMARASSSLFAQRYRSRGFRSRRLGHSSLLYKNNSSFSDDVFASDANWYVSLGDGDYCYYV